MEGKNKHLIPIQKNKCYDSELSKIFSQPRQPGKKILLGPTHPTEQGQTQYAESSI